MRKYIFLSTIILLISFFKLNAQDTDKILERHFQKINQEKLNEVENITITGEVVQAGMSFPMTLIQKRPDKAKMIANIQGNEIIQSYDGTTGWIIMPMTGSNEAVKMDNEQERAIKQLANIDGDLYNWKEKDHQLELKGQEDMNGDQVYVLTLTSRDGNEFTYYIDSDNYLLLRADTKTTVHGVPLTVATHYSDHKEVKGIIFPHLIESKTDQQTISKIIINSYELNEDVNDAIFEMPKNSSAK